jgi:hypothetical protein
MACADAWQKRYQDLIVAYLFTHPSGFTKQQSDPPPAPPQA